MKNYIRCIILLIVILFWLFPCEAEEVTIYQVEKQMNNVLEEMDIVLQKLSEKYDEFTPEEPLGKALWSALEKSKKNAKIIFSFSFSSEINYSELFQLFLSTLEYDTEAFKRFIQFTNTGRILLSISSPEVSEVLDVSLDLELKAELIQKSHKYYVEVTVNTKNKQGEEVNNCIVWYAPFFLKDNEQDKRQFDKWSTPTTHSIPAGYWAIWTEKKGKLGVKKRFECGDDGRWKREIDIPSPE
jgi:hypothetical protein